MLPVNLMKTSEIRKLVAETAWRLQTGNSKLYTFLERERIHSEKSPEEQMATNLLWVELRSASKQRGSSFEKCRRPFLCQTSAPTVLTDDEELIIAKHLIFAAKIRFAVGKDSFKSTVTKTVSDRRPAEKI